MCQNTKPDSIGKLFCCPVRVYPNGRHIFHSSYLLHELTLASLRQLRHQLGSAYNFHKLLTISFCPVSLLRTERANSLEMQQSIRLSFLGNDTILAHTNGRYPLHRIRRIPVGSGTSKTVEPPNGDFTISKRSSVSG